MTDEELAAAIRKECSSGDTEADHVRADELLVDFLRRQGLTQAADAYEAVDKWYA